MKNNTEKRACERWKHTALIAFSYFNQEPSFDTQTLNYCLDGMCFKSSFFLQPGATLCIMSRPTLYQHHFPFNVINIDFLFIHQKFENKLRITSF